MLLGLLAFRIGLIDRRQLADAVLAWEKDPSQSLGQWLAGHRLIDEMHRGLLQEFADEIIIRHRLEFTGKPAGDLRNRRLAEIGRRLLPDLFGALPDSPEIPPTLDGALNQPADLASGDAPVLPSEERGRREDFGSSSGMQRAAWDGSCARGTRNWDGPWPSRKSSRITQTTSPAKRGFVLEAEITGGLEHPGIVPVYSLGTLHDGRPYYAMRFIRGENLNEAIGGFHEPGRPVPRTDGQRLLELHKLLRRFIDVCNAIRYAHSRGVLHRDIKPGNVMLGKYGETLVVDWGVAKLMVARKPPPTRARRTASRPPAAGRRAMLASVSGRRHT